MEKGVSASLQEHGMKISQSGEDVTSKKQVGEQPTAGNGEKVSNVITIIMIAAVAVLLLLLLRHWKES